MVEALRLQLDDGTIFDAIVEGDGADEEALRTLGRLRLELEDLDVEGHAPSSTVGVIVYGPDDVEGHAMTLRLPHTDAARDLQRKLLAAGVVGAIVVGAAATAMWVPDNGIGTATSVAAPAAAPAPAISRGLQAERGMDQVAIHIPPPPAISRGLQAELNDGVTPSTPLTAPAISRGLQAELNDGVTASTPLTAPAESRGLQAERGMDQVASVTPLKAPPVSRGLQAERGMDQVATPDAPDATQAAHQGMRPE
jgi:hypothetical protein